MDEQPNPEDGLPEGLQGFLKLIEGLAEALSNPVDAIVEQLSEEDKEKYEKINKRLQARAKELESLAFKYGCTAFGFGRMPIVIDTFGADSVYDERTCMVGGIEEGACFLSDLSNLVFPPESDGEIYAKDQLRPEGIAPSIVCRAYTVHRRIPNMFSGMFEEKKEPALEDMLCDAVLLEFAEVVKKERSNNADHFHYDLHLLARKEFETEELLGSKQLTIPALPIDQSDHLDFMSSMEFMSEEEDAKRRGK